MDTYRCECCNGVFEKSWSEAEAKGELTENFPGFAEEDCAIVCDDCYRKVMGEQHGL